MIDTKNQAELGTWLCQRIGLVPTYHLMCIGRRSSDRIVGVVGYDGYNGASVMMHVAGEGNWFSKEMLFAVFDYPFNILGVNIVIGLVPSDNTQAIRFNTHIGFKVEKVIDGAHPDGALWIMSMARRECRFLSRNRSHHGQKEQAAEST